MSDSKGLDTLLAVVMSEVAADTGHELSPLRRRDVYTALEGAAGACAVGWLGVVTAQRVVPIWQQAYPEDPSPQELLETAIGVLEGKVSADDAAEAVNIGYLASGAAWGYDEREIPWPAWFAGNACYFALKEASGQAPLFFLPEYIKGDESTPWSDVDLSEWDFCDSAASAALASAGYDGRAPCDPTKLLEFWEWWLTDALQEAGRLAALSPPLDAEDS